MKKGRIAISLICATALTSAAMLPAFAASEPDDVPAAAIGHACAINTNATFAASDEIPEEIIIEGEPGDFFVVGDLVFEIVTPEEVESVVTAPETRASTSRWSISLSGTEMSKGIEVISSITLSDAEILLRIPAYRQGSIHAVFPVVVIVFVSDFPLIHTVTSAFARYVVPFSASTDLLRDAFRPSSSTLQDSTVTH